MILTEKLLRNRKLFHQDNNLGPVFPCLIRRLRLQVTQLAAEMLLRLLRHHQPLPRSLQFLFQTRLSFHAVLQLFLQLFVSPLH
ncbi:hypothetical protein MIMGU_mgv1a017301mg [Erythranthe guttata]|uniref:Uncharacterized protein n=1 Tax=Erythranthe guttata TaxID=4155 RepID=A0A022PXZ3_ERYGU|nr:hypothetical protein MIMGU_mgv1a017301mg [Erythranthe guttata]